MIGATNGRKSKKGKAHTANGWLYTDEEFEFIKAVDAFRRKTGIPFLAANGVSANSEGYGI